jgi:hypothetical protein
MESKSDAAAARGCCSEGIPAAAAAYIKIVSAAFSVKVKSIFHLCCFLINIP